MDFFSVGHNFGILERRSRMYITAVCAPWNIGYSEYVILRCLYKNEGVYQDEIAAIVVADKAQVARNVNTLEKKGYIVRRQDDQDKRFKHIYLTPKGEKLRKPLQIILDRWILCLTAGMEPGLMDMTIKGMRVAAQNAVAADIDKLDLKKEVVR